MDKQKVFKLLMEVMKEIDPTTSELTIRYHQPPEGGIGDTFEISIPENRSARGKIFERLVYADLFREGLNGR
jgi:hypothetical protein